MVIKIGEKEEESKIDEKKVPQTSKQLIGYDRNTNELVILVTGLPTSKSAKDLNNYVLNGKTLKELGASKVLFGDAKTNDFTVVGTTALTGVEYKVIRIELPKNSVENQVSRFHSKRISSQRRSSNDRSYHSSGLEDNTAPKYVSGKIKDDGIIELKFDEPLD